MNICLLAAKSSLALGEAVSGHLSIPLRVLETKNFSDGEMKTRPPVNVRGQTVYLLQSLYAQPEQSIHDKLFEIFVAAGAIRDAGAKRIVLIAPYLCYARQDRRTEFLGAVTTRYLAELWEASGIGHVVTIDVHNASAFENSFRISTSNLSARTLFANEISDGPITVVSPDAGGIKRCEKLCEALASTGRKGVDLAYVIKKRQNDEVLPEEIVLGHLQGRSVVILDDMISTGDTIAHAVQACWKRGAGEIVVAATHGLLVDDAARKLSDLGIKQIVITNTVLAPAARSGPLAPLVKVVDSTRLIADEIRRLEM